MQALARIGANTKMPNQRQSGLKLLNVWVDGEIIEILRAEAASTGKDVSALVREMIEKHINARPKRQHQAKAAHGTP